RLARAIGTGAGAGASWLRARVRRPPVGDWGATAVRFRHETIDLVRTRWMHLSVTTVVSQLSLYLVLLLALRNLGVSEDQVGWAEVLAAFAFVRLLSALPITPGGLGVVELGLVASLVAAGGARPQVVAAVLVYRALTYLAPVPLGLVGYVVWRRRGAWRGGEPESGAPGTEGSGRSRAFLGIGRRVPALDGPGVGADAVRLGPSLVEGVEAQPQVTQAGIGGAELGACELDAEL
ncbi:MAG TPA: YbhN family protein, partial [Acidimicrobiia bacterium]